MLAACGTAGSETPVASNEGAALDDAASTGTANVTIPTSDLASDQADSVDGTPVIDPPATTAGPETTDGDPPADDAKPAEPAWPDDGCSADNTPSPTEAADAPAPVLEIRTESAASPLPDLAVRRINCNGGWVNLRNELPSELPLLVWFWAPH